MFFYYNEEENGGYRYDKHFGINFYGSFSKNAITQIEQHNTIRTYEYTYNLNNTVKKIIIGRETFNATTEEYEMFFTDILFTYY